MSDWKEHEEYWVNALKNDQATRIPGSGSTKGEEDVVGETILVQCKSTDNESTSLLKKDIDRLIKNAGLLDKFPLFSVESSTCKMVCIPVNDDTIGLLTEALEYIRIRKNVDTIESYLAKVKDVKPLKETQQWTSSVERCFYKVVSGIKQRLSKIQEALDQRWIDLTHGNLFDEHENQ